MILIVILVILYPILTAKEGKPHCKTAPLRGGLIGFLLAVILGYILPTTTNRIYEVAAMKIEKIRHSQTSVRNGDYFDFILIDNQNRITENWIEDDSPVISISNNDKIKLFVCNNVAKYDWEKYIAIFMPRKIYEIESPKDKLHLVMSPTPDDKPVVLLDEMPK